MVHKQYHKSVDNNNNNNNKNNNSNSNDNNKYPSPTFRNCIIELGKYFGQENLILGKQTTVVQILVNRENYKNHFTE